MLEEPFPGLIFTQKVAIYRPKFHDPAQYSVSKLGYTRPLHAMVMYIVAEMHEQLNTVSSQFTSLEVEC